MHNLGRYKFYCSRCKCRLIKEDADDRVVQFSMCGSEEEEAAKLKHCLLCLLH